MCRLALKTANEPFSPYTVLTAMEAMKEGYDGSGLGLLLRGMEFEDFKYNPRFPILSGVAHSKKAEYRLDEYMDAHGYELKYDHRFAMKKGLIECLRVLKINPQRREKRKCCVLELPYARLARTMVEI